MADLSRYKCSSHTNGGEHACSNGAAIQRKNIEDVILATTRDQLLSPKIFKLVKKELQILLKKEQQRRANADPRADLKAKLAECKKQISRLARVASLTDDIEDVVIKLNGAKQEQKELQAKLQSTPKTLSALPNAVYGGLEYYREQVAAMAASTGDQATDAQKPAILANLLGEIRLRRQRVSVSWRRSSAQEQRRCPP